MIEVLHFVFSSFYVWLGTLILIAAIGQSFAAIVVALRGDK